MKMEFNSSFSSLSRGDEENQGENTHMPAATERLVKKRKICLVSTRAEGHEDSEVFPGQFLNLKLEVPEITVSQSDDDAQLQFPDPPIQPTDTVPVASSSSQNLSSIPKNITAAPGKKKFAWRCRHCPYKTNNRFSYADHLKTHLRGSTASACDACSIYVFQEDIKSHQQFHRISESSGSTLVYDSSDDENEDNSSKNSTSDDDEESRSSIADENYDAAPQRPEPSQPEVVDLGHFSSAPVFMDEDEEYIGELETEPFPIHGNYSRRSSSSSNTRLYHVCPYCPYESLYSRCVEKHLEVHSEKANSAAPCRRCGTYVSGDKKCSCSSTPVRKRKKLPTKTKEIFQDYSVRVRTIKSQPNPEYSCNYCPYTILRSVAAIDSHVELHGPTSQAIPCEFCGIYILPEKMASHNKYQHQQLPKAIRKKMMEVKKKKKEPNRDFLSSYDLKKKRFYKCYRCGLRTSRLYDMESHVELHKDGSGAVACEICKQIMLPEQMQPHLEASHSAYVRQQDLSLQCAACPHESKITMQADKHSLLHLEGSGAIPCPKCDVYHRPTPSNPHQLVCDKYQQLKQMKINVNASQECSSGSLNATNTTVGFSGGLE